MRALLLVEVVGILVFPGRRLLRLVDRRRRRLLLLSPRDNCRKDPFVPSPLLPMLLLLPARDVLLGKMTAAVAARRDDI